MFVGCGVGGGECVRRNVCMRERVDVYLCGCVCVYSGWLVFLCHCLNVRCIENVLRDLCVCVCVCVHACVCVRTRFQCR